MSGTELYSGLTRLESRLVNDFAVPIGDMNLVEERRPPEDSIGNSCDYTDSSSKTILVEIKTLIWEVSCSSSSQTQTQHQPQNGYDDVASHKEEQDGTFYVITALPMASKVQASRLRDLIILPNHPQQGSSSQLCLSLDRTKIIKISLAHKEVAESLTGFPSGSIPPIGNKTPMPLFLESSIVAEQSSSSSLVVSFGSGVPGKSLLLPWSQFLRVAQENSKGCTIGSFLQQPTTSRPPPQTPPLSSNHATSLRPPERRCPLEIRRQQKLERCEISRPEPKNRLEEYRKCRTLKEKAKLLRTTARKQGREADMKQLVDEAVSQGDFSSLFLVSDDTAGGDGEMDKNSLHLCAWRGDFASVQLMVRTAQRECPDLDIVNLVSKGSGNYGKTPIFFALTQCREDVVRFLVEEGGANLLIVNNKGQTPCSIAVSHLKDEACQYLFDVEAQQLARGGTFINYRATHSDHKLYGDLDPRFPIDAANLGDDDDDDDNRHDLDAQMAEFQRCLKEASSDTFHNGIPTQFTPRSLRPTVRWWVREARSLSAANRGDCSDGLITFTQPRQPVVGRRKTEKVPSPHRSRSPHREDDTIESIVDIASLELLKLEDVLESSSESVADSCVYVKDGTTLRVLEQEIDDSTNRYSGQAINGMKTTTTTTNDEIFVNSTWGLDCEWKPGIDCGLDNPVATLQLGTRRKVFLLDLPAVCQDARAGVVEPTCFEEDLNAVLSKLFLNPNLHLLGYGILQDLGKLTASFPHLSCFGQFESVIDLQSVATVAFSKAKRQTMSSLQKMTAILLRKRLDKTQQTSDWTFRPLSDAQLTYAMLDASVLPLLLECICQQSSIVQRYNGQFFKVHAHLQSTFRFSLLEQTVSENYTYDVPMGTIKVTLGRAIARQNWSTAGHVIPDLPKLVEREQTERSSSRVSSDPKTTQAKKDRKKSKPVQLHALHGNLGNLPIPGTTLGYTKESCVFRVLGHELLNTFPEGTYIGFNRRAGVVHTSNAWILFCNFGGSNIDRGGMFEMYNKKVSEFFQGGRQLSFRLNPTAQSGRSSEAALFRYIVSSYEDAGPKSLDPKPILLFARDGTQSKYVYCGLCKCQETRACDDNSLILLLELLDFEFMVGERKISDAFEGLVSSQKLTVERIR